MVAPKCLVMLLRILVGLISMCNVKKCITRITTLEYHLHVNTSKGPEQVILHLSPSRVSPYFPMRLIETSFHLYQAMIGWTVYGRVHQKSNAKKVTYLSPIMAFGNLTF